MLLMPPSYEEMIPEDHLVRVVNRAVEELNVESLVAQYVGGGTSSYHPKMMLKVLVYAYCQKIYTSRRIAAALRENIHFIWLSGGNRPDFRTINGFRGERMKGVIGDVLGAVVEYLVEEGYVKLEDVFVDGSKIEADGNKHKVVWAKRKERYEKQVKEQVRDLLKQIEKANEEEQAEYGERDLEEMGGNGSPDINSERLKKKIEELNQRLREKVQTPQQEKQTHQAMKKLEENCLPRLEKYEEQTRILNGRNSYSKTDPSATCMRMKEDRGAKRPWPKPAYNVQLATAGQFIVGTTVHNQSSDTPCFIPLMQSLRFLPQNVAADAAYGSEENYDYLEEHSLGNYLKYNTFYQDTHHYRNQDIVRKHQFRSDHFEYEQQNDQFLCPANRRLSYLYTSQQKTANGYLSTRRHYACDNCQDCALKSQCTKAKGNRQIQVSFKLREYRRQARENLTSERGKQLRAQRSVDTETVFGNQKHNMGFRRFHLRGQEKVKTEWLLVCIAHNMRKLAV
ncbi:MAG TPA: IS1182 family transposase [Burkholderiaceae bacterium]|nr:IS1182 family transposase [Burkholderiaceae bacterium]